MNLEPGIELDALVATKIFGHTLEKVFPDPKNQPDRFNYIVNETGSWLPSYSTHLYSALEVLEKFENGYSIIMHKNWNKVIIHLKDRDIETIKMNPDLLDETVKPFLICMAALKAMEAVND